MAGRRSYVVGMTLLAGFAACQPYESKTVELGERGIQPVLTQAELSDAKHPSTTHTDPARRTSQEERTRRLLRAQEAYRRQGLIVPLRDIELRQAAEREAKIEEEFERRRELKEREIERRGLEIRPLGAPPVNRVRRDERRAPVRSQELDTCIARYRRHQARVDEFGKQAPPFVMIRLSVGRPPERVSCSRVRSHSRMGGDKAQVYRRYLSECAPLRASGPVYESARAQVEETKSECMSLARAAGVSPGEMRSRLR